MSSQEPSGPDISGDELIAIESAFGDAVMPSIKQAGLLTLLRQTKLIQSIFLNKNSAEHAESKQETFDAEKELEAIVSKVSGVEQLQKYSKHSAFYHKLLLLPTVTDKKKEEYYLAESYLDNQDLILWLMNATNMGSLFAREQIAKQINQNKLDALSFDRAGYFQSEIARTCLIQLVFEKRINLDSFMKSLCASNAELFFIWLNKLFDVAPQEAETILTGNDQPGLVPSFSQSRVQHLASLKKTIGADNFFACRMHELFPPRDEKNSQPPLTKQNLEQCIVARLGNSIGNPFYLLAYCLPQLPHIENDIIDLLKNGQLDLKSFLDGIPSKEEESKAIVNLLNIIRPGFFWPKDCGVIASLIKNGEISFNDLQQGLQSGWLKLANQTIVVNYLSASKIKFNDIVVLSNNLPDLWTLEEKMWIAAFIKNGLLVEEQVLKSSSLQRQSLVMAARAENVDSINLAVKIVKDLFSNKSMGVIEREVLGGIEQVRERLATEPQTFFKKDSRIKAEQLLEAQNVINKGLLDDIGHYLRSTADASPANITNMDYRCFDYLRSGLADKLKQLSESSTIGAHRNMIGVFLKGFLGVVLSIPLATIPLWFKSYRQFFFTPRSQVKLSQGFDTVNTLTYGLSR